MSGHQGKAQLPFASAKRDSRELRKDLPDTATGSSAHQRGHSNEQAGLQDQRSSSAALTQQRDRSGHDAQRNAAMPPGKEGHEIATSIQLARQSLRALGFLEIKRQCKLRFPKYNRKEINQLAKQLHDEAWRNRDKQAVDRFLHGS